MAFEPFEHKEYSAEESVARSAQFREELSGRRSIRHFSRRAVPVEVVENVVMTASSSPSGANMQPWTFVIVKDPKIKRDIRIAAEKEEKEFYTHRAPDEWLADLNQFGTDWHKPFLETAPYLIVVFKINYDLLVSPAGVKTVPRQGFMVIHRPIIKESCPCRKTF